MSDARRAVVVFDMDGTLVHGDSAAQLIRHLLRRQLWRRATATMIAPVGKGLMAIPRTRRIGVSLFFWIATAGHSEASLQSEVEAFVQSRPLRRIEPAIAALQSELDAGSTVVIATGAFQQLAEFVVATLQLRGQPLVVGSTIRMFAGGFIARSQANGIHKLGRLAEHGMHPPFDRAWSDHEMDLPLLCAARESHWVTHAPVPEHVRAKLPELIVHTYTKS